MVRMLPHIQIVNLDQISRYKTEADAPCEAKDKDRNVKALCYLGFLDEPFEFGHGITCSAESNAEYDGEAEESKYSYFDTFDVCH
jgi:hypothetical protein